MKKKYDYRDEWDILPDKPAKNELRACAIYEYARESELLLKLVENHGEEVLFKKNRDVDAITYIGCFSFALRRMAYDLGATASLAKPWKKLSATKRNTLAKVICPSVQMASYNDIMLSVGEEPAFDYLADVAPMHHGVEAPVRMIPILIDCSQSPATLERDISIFVRKEVLKDIGPTRGRNATGDEAWKKAIRDLAIMRLLSSRSIEKARLICGGLIPEHGGERTISRRIADARKMFQTLFPSLFHWIEEAGDDECAQMISYQHYKARHPGWGKSINPRQKQSGKGGKQ